SVKKQAKYLGLATTVLVVLLQLVVPLSAGAEPLGNHISVNVAVSPHQPVVGADCLLTITLSDSSKQAIANASISITADKVPVATAAGHAGMNMGGSQPAAATLRAAAKATANKGEYVANLRIPEAGQWRIMVAAGDASAHLDVDAVVSQPGSSNRAAATSAVATVAPAEAVHASYLDLTGNIAELRTRIGEWQKGDLESLKTAQDRLARIMVVLGSITWPAEMKAAIGKTALAVEPMAKAMRDGDVASAQTAATALGDGSHDVTHAFYPDWLPGTTGAGRSLMAPHAIYLDLAANISDLSSRVAAWQKGDESSLNIAKEKSDRIALVLPHMVATGVSLKTVKAIERSLPAVNDALEKKDAAAAQAALKPISDASPNLTRDFYTWMNVTAGATNLACIQASYLDLTANIAYLRTGVSEWQTGNQDSLKTAQERLDRAKLVLDHPDWPVAMATPIGEARASLDTMTRALNSKDLASASSAASALGNAFAGVTRAYYSAWLPSAKLDSAQGQPGTIQSGVVPAVDLSHDHGSSDSSLPSYWFLGSIVGLVLITIALVPVLRRRDLAVQHAEDR
ncbi:MAG: hypothetical protein Q7R39_19050, partial [Dehalococcoidia bacterium]|nr:hypothetical protein [Dehalococcoidia bacterium]